MQMYLTAGTPQKWKIRRSCVSVPTLALLTHSFSFCLFGRGKKNPPNSSLKSFLLLASISFSNLNTWWFDVTAFENRRLRALLLRHSAAHPDGYLTEDVGPELAQNSRTSLLLHKGQKPAVQRTVLFTSYPYKAGSKSCNRRLSSGWYNG